MEGRDSRKITNLRPERPQQWAPEPHVARLFQDPVPAASVDVRGKRGKISDPGEPAPAMAGPMGCKKKQLVSAAKGSQPVMLQADLRASPENLVCVETGAAESGDQAPVQVNRRIGRREGSTTSQRAPASSGKLSPGVGVVQAATRTR